MTQEELFKKDLKDLHLIINDLKAKLFMLRFQNATGQLDKSHQIKLVKHDIARVFTVINAKKRNKTIKAKGAN